MSQPPWLTAAWRYVGTRETKGDGSTPEVLGFYRKTGHPHVLHDEVAWCAAFVGACLHDVNLPHTNSLLARSYLKLGKPLRKPRIGAIAVLTRGRNPHAGHVGFYLGETNDTLFLLGGNQGDAVTVAQFARSRLLGYRWPEAVANPDTAQLPEPPAHFDQLLEHIFKMEGGWTDDPHDPGGPTNRGIILSVFAAHRGQSLTPNTHHALKEDLRRITRNEAEEIYLTRYWHPSGCNDLAPALAAMHFDCAVNQGVGRAIRFLQRSLGVEADGEIGPITRAAIKTQQPEAVLTAYAQHRSNHYKSLHHFWRFGRGWLNRLAATAALAKRLLAETPPPTPANPSTQTTPTKEPASMPTPMNQAQPKWWGKSLTIWGTIITAASTVLPVVAPLFGFDITADMIETFGKQVATLLQAIGGVIGTLMALYGRASAQQTLKI